MKIKENKNRNWQGINMSIRATGNKRSFNLDFDNLHVVTT